MFEIFAGYSPAFIAIFVLMLLSAFFSSSEAAYFSLSQSDRRTLENGGRLARSAARLASDSERLLNSILLGNLIVNLLTFTLSSVIAFQLQHDGHADWAGVIAVGTLFSVILFCEVLPKNLGVIAPRFFTILWALPLSFVLRFLQPLLPVLQRTNILSRRLFCPKFLSEPHLRVGDLERAVEMSQKDATLLKREQRVLQNIVSLSDMRAEELMRPRSLLKIFKPSISFPEILDALHDKLPRSGYCLLTDPNSDEIASILSFTRLTPEAMDSWKDHFEPTVYVPWSASVAEVFDRLREDKSDVAVVINEFGETVGILTLDDIIETIFTREQGRSRRLSDRLELKKIGPNLWVVNELTSLRRLQRKFELSTKAYSSLTVGGLLREILERFPRKGDLCCVDGYEFRVVNADEDDGLVVHLSKRASSDKTDGNNGRNEAGVPARFRRRPS